SRLGPDEKKTPGRSGRHVSPSTGGSGGPGHRKLPSGGVSRPLFKPTDAQTIVSRLGQDSSCVFGRDDFTNQELPKRKNGPQRPGVRSSLKQVRSSGKVRAPRAAASFSETASFEFRSRMAPSSSCSRLRANSRPSLVNS